MSIAVTPEADSTLESLGFRATWNLPSLALQRANDDGEFEEVRSSKRKRNSHSEEEEQAEEQRSDREQGTREKSSGVASNK